MIFCFYPTLLLSFQCFTFGKMIVTQVPQNLNPAKGDSVNVTCSWNIVDTRRVKVEWWKYHKSHTWDENGTLLLHGVWTNNMATSKWTQNRSSYIITKDTAVMTLESITEEDEGRYVCKVVSDIPDLKTGEGNITILHIQDNTYGSIPFWYLYFIILLIIPILIPVYCCFHRWKRGRELHQDHTYGNMTRNTQKNGKHPGTKSKKNTKKTIV